jgi:DNA-binding NarL/FixJ family response regulator
MATGKKTRRKSGQRAPDAPRVGLICGDRPLADRIRKALDGAGFALAFSISPAELHKSQASRVAEVLVVTGSLRSGDSSPYPGVRARFPEGRLVACAPSGDGQVLRSAVDRGVDGVVWESHLDQTLASTIQAVRAGQFVVPLDMLGRHQPEELTNREKQALSLVIMGLTNREIAQKLYVSESTVKSHLNTAYRKLRVHSRAEAVRVIADPDAGLGTGILAITGPGLARGRTRRG